MNKIISNVVASTSPCASLVKNRVIKTVKNPRFTMMVALLFVFTLGIMADTAATGGYEAGKTALSSVTEEINFGVNPTKYNTCIKSYLSNNNTSYTMNYSVKVNYNNT